MSRFVQNQKQREKEKQQQERMPWNKNKTPTPPPRTVESRIIETGDKAGQAYDTFMNAGNNVQLFKPQTVTPQKVRPAVVQTPTGTQDMTKAVQMAQGNVAQAGQMDPRTLAFLQAAQQQGQYSPQAMQMMQQAAMGQGPSAAQAQLQSGVDQAIKAQMAAAGSRGFSPAAMRGAQMQGAEMQQVAVNQAAQLRAQEQQAAQAAFLQGALEQENMARTAALQAGATNLQADIAGKQARQAAINSVIGGSEALLQSGTQTSLAQANLNQGAALANQDVALKAGLFNSQMGLDAASLQQQGRLGYGQLGVNALGAQFGAYNDVFAGKNAAQMQRESSRSSFNQALAGGLIAAGGAVGAAAIMSSDRNAKKDIKANKETQAFLSALTDNEYRYKDTTKPGTAKGKQYGPMAQDLMKTKMGRTAVIDTPDGLMVDSSRGFLLALSGLANINQRLSALEAR